MMLTLRERTEGVVTGRKNRLASLLHAPHVVRSTSASETWERHVNILHRLTFTRGSEALDFVRTLRELSDVRPGGELHGIGPVLVYGARIVAPDAPAELYASLGALTLVHALGINAAAVRNAKASRAAELPADMALLFAAESMPDEYVVRGA